MDKPIDIAEHHLVFSRLALAPLLLASCVATSTPQLHHPDLSLATLAKTSEANSAVFKSYNPNGPVRWNQGWPWKLDLTGIGWDEATTVTAITARHVVMAKHFQRQAGGTAVFHDRDGKPHRRMILKIIPTSEVGLPSDVSVGLLDRPLPKSIRTYPLLSANADEAAQLIGAHVLVTEQSRRLFFHQIRNVNDTSIQFQYDPQLADSKKKRLIPGDSGNPSFVLSKGELALVETHTGGGPGAGPFYGSPKMIEALQKIIAQLDSSYQLRTVGIDQRLRKEAAPGRATISKGVATTAQTATPKPSTPSAPPTRRPRPRIVVPDSP